MSPDFSEAGCCLTRDALFRAPLEEVDSSSYVLSEEEYAANEVDATWLDRLLNIMVAIMQWFQPLLTAGNYDWLVATLIAKVRGNEPIYTSTGRP